MKLNLVGIDRGGYIRVAVEGKITFEDFDANGVDPLAGLMGSSWATNRVLLDLSQASYIDSAAIGWLLGCNRQFRAEGGALVIHSIPGNIAQMLELLRIGKVLRLARDEEEARQLLQRPAPAPEPAPAPAPAPAGESSPADGGPS